MSKRLIASFFAFACATAQAWGPRGHEYSGAIADALLTAKARVEVAQILAMPLMKAATWTDCVKDVQRSTNGFRYFPDPKYHAACSAFETAEGKAEMIDYVRRNWNNCSSDSQAKECHKEYHFADVAIQHDHYDRGYVGTSDHDIVQAINAAILVLQGNPAPSPFKFKNKREALFLLAHLVGDLHQPLHVGAIYINDQDQPIDPDNPPGSHDPTTDTRGGNSIDVGSSNLHADWDNILSSLKADAVSVSVIKKARALPKPTGPIGDWAATWASDTVVQSQKAYSGISYSHPGTKGKWSASFDDRKAYSTMKRQLQLAQLEKAGAHLADVLNEIYR